MTRAKTNNDKTVCEICAAENVSLVFLPLFRAAREQRFPVCLDFACRCVSEPTIRQSRLAAFFRSPQLFGKVVARSGRVFARCTHFNSLDFLGARGDHFHNVFSAIFVDKKNMNSFPFPFRVSECFDLPPESSPSILRLAFPSVSRMLIHFVPVDAIFVCSRARPMQVRRHTTHRRSPNARRMRSNKSYPHIFMRDFSAAIRLTTTHSGGGCFQHVFKAPESLKWSSEQRMHSFEWEDGGNKKAKPKKAASTRETY